MKKVLVLAAAVALFATPALAASIINSKHDLKVYGGTGQELCVFCHTPHGAQTSTVAPLWNRTDNVNATVVYTSATLNATVALGTVNASDAPLCLSCHDGTVGTTLGNQPNAGAITAAPALSATATLGSDLSNDHPIGFNYTPAQTADAGLYLKGTVEGTAGMAGALSFGTGDQMWCSSCHDVHDQANAPFLRKSNAASALCLSCHNK